MKPAQPGGGCVDHRLKPDSGGGGAGGGDAARASWSQWSQQSEMLGAMVSNWCHGPSQSEPALAVKVW